MAKKPKLDVTFKANGKTYHTDKETLQLLREYRDDQKPKMFALAFYAGKSAGRIVPVKPKAKAKRKK